MEWSKVIESPEFSDLSTSEQNEIRQHWVDNVYVPQLLKEGIPEEDIPGARYEALDRYDNGQGYVSSFASSAAQGLLGLGTSAIQGVGVLSGLDSLEEVGTDLQESVQESFTTNPVMDKTNFTGQVLGNVAGFIGTAGAGGLVGKGLGAAARGAEIGGLGTGFLAGAGGGAQEADEYGITGEERYLRALGGGLTEVLTEKIPGLGMASELRAISRIPGLGGLASPAAGGVVRAVGSEIVEENLANIGGNVLTDVLAPDGVATPGMFDGTLEATAGGAIGGAAFGGLGLLAPSTKVNTAAVNEAEKAGDTQAAEILRQVGADARMMPVPPPTVPDLKPGETGLEDLLPEPAPADFTPLTTEALPPEIEGLNPEPVLPPSVAPVVDEAQVAAPPVAPMAEPDQEAPLTPEQEAEQKAFESSLIDRQGRISVPAATQVFDAINALTGGNVRLVVNDSGTADPNTQGVRGSLDNGTVYLNRNLVRADTPVHEMGHALIPTLRESNPELFAQGQALIAGAAAPLADAIRARYTRREKELTPEAFEHEVLTTLYGNETAQDWQQYVRDPGMIQQIKQWIARIREWADGLFRSKGIDPNMSMADFAKRLNRQVLAGKVRAPSVPVAGQQESFAGENAQMGDLRENSLITAKLMQQRGRAPEEIRQVTGWFPGQADGKLRYEIPDRGARLKAIQTEDAKDVLIDRASDLGLTVDFGNDRALSVRKPGTQDRPEMSQLRDLFPYIQAYQYPVDGAIPRTLQMLADREESGNPMKLGEFLDHPELFKTYPALRDIKVTSRGLKTSSWDASNNTIDLATDRDWTEESLRSVVMHEAQHAIQNIEGFSRGSNPGMFTGPDAYLQYLDTPGEVEARDVQRRIDMTDAELAEITPRAMEAQGTAPAAEGVAASTAAPTRFEEMLAREDARRAAASNGKTFRVDGVQSGYASEADDAPIIPLYQKVTIVDPTHPANGSSIVVPLNGRPTPLPDDVIQAAVDAKRDQQFSLDEVPIVFDKKNGIGQTPFGQDINYFGFTTRMMPDQFLSIAAPGNLTKSFKGIEQAIRDGASIAPPMIFADWDEDQKVWKVTGHEGRNRSIAIKAINPDADMEVGVKPGSWYRAKHMTDEMKSAPFIPEKGGEPVTLGPRPTGRTVSQRDAEYAAAVESGDKAKQQMLVDEAAKAAGYTTGPAFHGKSADQKFTIFDPKMSEVRTIDGAGFNWFSSEPVVAKTYSSSPSSLAAVSVDGTISTLKRERRDFFPSKNYDIWVHEDTNHVVAYRTIGRNEPEYVGELDSEELPYRLAEWFNRNHLKPFSEQDMLGKFWLKMRNPKVTDFGGKKKTAPWGEGAKTAINEGHDGVIIRNVVDQMPAAFGVQTETPSDVFGVPKSNQIKSADPITRDDQGNVIPLSQRFNKESNDIRYSLDEPAVADTVANEQRTEAQRNAESKTRSALRLIGEGKSPSRQIAILRNSYPADVPPLRTQIGLGSEVRVYLKGDRVWKVTNHANNEFGIGLHDAKGYLERTLRANRDLGDTIRFEGVTPDGRIITSQKFIEGEEPAQDEVDAHLADLGLLDVSGEGDWVTPNGSYLWDTHTKNAIRTPQGQVVMIDAAIVDARDSPEAIDAARDALATAPPEVKAMYGWVDDISTIPEVYSPEAAFSLDDDYMAAVESGNVEEQQRLVDAAARRYIEGFPVSDNDNPIPNRSSISSSVPDNVSFGVREVPLSVFSGLGKKAFYNANDHKRVDALIPSIREEGIESPLIVVVDGHPDGAAYVLEGAHRLAAAEEIGIPSVPALVIYDTESEPIARDEAGNVIPLSQRFNEESNDIRYSLDEGTRQSGVAVNQPGTPMREIAKHHIYNSETGEAALDEALGFFFEEPNATFTQRLATLNALINDRGRDNFNMTPGAYFGLVAEEQTAIETSPTSSPSERAQAIKNLNMLMDVVATKAAAGGQFVKGFDLGLRLANNPRMQVDSAERLAPFRGEQKLRDEFDKEVNATTKVLDEAAITEISDLPETEVEKIINQGAADVIRGDDASDAAAAELESIVSPEADAAQAEDTPEHKSWAAKLMDKVRKGAAKLAQRWMVVMRAINVLNRKGDSSLSEDEIDADVKKLLKSMEDAGLTKAQQMAKLKAEASSLQKEITEDKDLKTLVDERLNKNLNRLLNGKGKKQPQTSKSAIATAITSAVMAKAGYAKVPVKPDMALAIGLLIANQGIAAESIQNAHTLLESDESTEGTISREKLKAFMELAVAKVFDKQSGADTDSAPFGEAQVAAVLRSEMKKLDTTMSEAIKDAAMERQTAAKLEAQLRDPARNLEKILGKENLDNVVNVVLGEYNKTASDRTAELRRRADQLESDKAVREAARDSRRKRAFTKRQETAKLRKDLSDATAFARAGATPEVRAARQVKVDELRGKLSSIRSEQARVLAAERADAMAEARRDAAEGARDAKEKKRRFIRAKKRERLAKRKAAKKDGTPQPRLEADELKDLMAQKDDTIIKYLTRNFGFNIKDLVKMVREADRKAGLEALTLKLADELGLTKTQAEKLLQPVIAAGMKKIDKARAKQVENRINKAIQKATSRDAGIRKGGQKTEAERLLDLAKMGGLTADNIEKVMLNNLNAKEFTPEFRKALETLLTKANDPNISQESRDVYTALFLNALRSVQGITATGILGEWTMSNIFMAVLSTLKVNAFWGFAKATVDNAVYGFYSGPKELMDAAKAAGAKVPKGIRKAYLKQWFRGYSTQMQWNAKYMMAEGRAKDESDYTVQFSNSFFELLAHNPETAITWTRDGKPLPPPADWIARRMAQFGKWTRRSMVATDLVNRVSAYEMLKMTAVTKAMLDGGKDLSGQQLTDIVDTALYGMPLKDALAKANKDVDAEIADGRTRPQEREIRIGGLLDEQMGRSLGYGDELRMSDETRMLEQDRARRAAGRRTVANQSEGLYGQISGLMLDATRRIPGLRFLMPAIRMPVGAFVQGLDWSPWGFARYRAINKNKGKSTSVTNSWVNPDNNKPFWNLPEGGVTPDMANDLWAKAWVGTTLMVGLFIKAGMDLDEDEDDADLYVTGMGPTDPMQKKLWREKGYTPFMVKFGPISVNYQESPMYPIFALVGAWSDAHRYGKKGDSDSAKFVYGIHKTIAGFKDAVVLRNLADVIGTGSGYSDESKAKQSANALARTASTVIAPRIGAEINNILFGKLDDQHWEAKIFANIPFVPRMFNRPALDWFGNEIHTRRGEAMGEVLPAVAHRISPLIVDDEKLSFVYRMKPNALTTSRRKKDGTQVMDDYDLVRQWHINSGKAAEKWLTPARMAYYDKLMKTDEDAALKEFDDELREIRQNELEKFKDVVFN